MKLEKLTKDHETASRSLMNGIKKLFPIGTRLMVEISHSKPMIEVEVTSHGSDWSIRFPHEIGVQNVKSGKTRRISVHPTSGHRYYVIG